MTPKELKNLKRLLKSGDEGNIRVAFNIGMQAMNVDCFRKYLHFLIAIHNYAFERYWKEGATLIDFWQGVRDKIKDIIDFINKEHDTTRKNPID